MDGKIMLRGLKRKAMESLLEDTDDPLQFYQQRLYLLELTVSKLRETYTRREKWGKKTKGPDYWKRALLRSTVIRYKKQKMEEEEAVEMAQNGSPLRETSRDGNPGSCTLGPAKLSMESEKETPCTLHARETGAPEVGNTFYSIYNVSELPAGQGAQEVPDCGPSSSNFYEITNHMDDLLMNLDTTPEQCLVEDLASPVSDDGLFLSSSEDPMSTFFCFSPEEPLNDPLPGTLEDIVTNYLGDPCVEKMNTWESETTLYL